MGGGTAGALLLVACAALLFLAFRLYRAGQPGRAVLALAALGLALRGFAACDLQLHAWDERYHAVVAKNLARHPLTPTLYDDPVLPGGDPGSWLSGSVWLHKPPLALWLIAASLRTFGVHEIAVRLPSVALSTASILLTYLLGAWLLDRRAGVLAAYFHAVNGFLIDLASGRTATDHVDTAFIVLVELAIVLAVLHVQRGRRPVAILGAGIVLGLAILTKWLGALLVVPVWFALALGRTSRRDLALSLLALLAAATAVALPWQILIHQRFPSEAAFEARYAARHAFEVLEGHVGRATYYLAGMPRTFGELIYVPVAWFLFVAVRPRAERTWRALAVWVLLPYVVFSMMATKMPGYVMTAAPAVFLMEAAFWWRLRDALPTGRWRWPSVALLGLLALLPLRYGIERVKPFEGFAVEPRWAADLRALGRRSDAGPAVLFNTPHPIEAMFYTPWPAYPELPSVDQARTLARRGYRVLVLDGGNVPAELRGEPNITVVTPPDADSPH